MIVARQFIAWYPCENGNRPVGNGMIGSDGRATIRATSQPGIGSDHICGTDYQLNGFQAINCLATIIPPGQPHLVAYRVAQTKADPSRCGLSKRRTCRAIALGEGG